MWRIATSDKMDLGHAEFGGPGQLRSSAGWVKFPPKRTLVLLDAGTYLLGAKCRAFLREQRRL